MLHRITFTELIDSTYISEKILLKYCKDIYRLNQKIGFPAFKSEPQSIDEIRGYCTKHFTYDSLSHEEAIMDLCNKINNLYTPNTWEYHPTVSHFSIL